MEATMVQMEKTLINRIMQDPQKIHLNKDRNDKRICNVGENQ